MNRLMKCLLVALLSFLASGQILGAELIVFPNVRSEYASTRVSDDGSTVAGQHPVIGAWVWRRGQGVLPLEWLPNFPSYGAQLRVRDLSADGSTLLVRVSGGSTFDLVWNSTGDSVELGPRSFGVGKGLSSDGQTAGVSIRMGANGAANFSRWTSDGGLMPLGPLPGLTASQSYGQIHDISSDGSAILGSSNEFGGPFLWTESNGYQRIGNEEHPSRFQIWGMSGDGSTVVGQYERPTTTNPNPTNPGDWEFGAYIWNRHTGVETLFNANNPEVPGLGRASAASFDGSIIVGDNASSNESAVSPSGSGGGAFMWDAVHGLRSLESVAQSRGIDLQGREFYSVDDMSPDGRFIVGQMAGYPSQPGAPADDWAYILDLGAPVPEPAGMALAAVVLAVGHRLTRTRRSYPIAG